MLNIKNKEGFTLLELSVVLVVIALVLGASISLGAARIEAQNINSTREKLDSIEQAITRYISQGGSAIVNGLPCPADGSLPPTNAAYGFSVATCDATGYPNIFNNTVPNAGQIIGGVVPTGNLFLPPEYMLDGWGNKFSYHIDRRFSLVANMQTDPTAADNKVTTPVIVVKTTCTGATCSDAPDQTNDITRNGIVVILSHGPDGLGAWRRVPSGGNLRNSSAGASADELANYATGCLPGGNANAAPCNTYDRTFVARTTDTTFDDIVRFKQRWQLIPVEGGGGIIKHPTPACNRPTPNAAGLAGLNNLTTYACPDVPRRCVLSYIRSTFAFNPPHACADPNGCFADFTAADESANAVGDHTPGGATPLIPVFMCIGRDGSPVLCRGAASNPVALTDIYSSPSGVLGKTPSVVSPVTSAGNCFWWQY